LVPTQGLIPLATVHPTGWWTASWRRRAGGLWRQLLHRGGLYAESWTEQTRPTGAPEAAR
jgi:hypothetical protein